MVYAPHTKLNKELQQRLPNDISSLVTRWQVWM